MARAIWSGTVNFGLVTIPIQLFTAVRPNELRFHFLHDRDGGRLSTVRVCDICGKNVAWENVVRGFEYEKGKHVVLTDEDFKRVDVEATQSIDITEFVETSEIDPMLFDTPYYLVPEKKGRHAYALLRDVLAKGTKVGIARVVLRTREHLAAVRPHGNALILELMHFADELVGQEGLDLPAKSEKASAGEVKSATMLIDAMAATFDFAAFKDTYREELTALIEARARGQTVEARTAKPRPATNVIDLREVLDESLAQTRKSRPAAAHAPRRAPAYRRASR
ncbi:Ku protein [bacterium]|nr:MAG: Ku protein [bacterium]